MSPRVLSVVVALVAVLCIVPAAVDASACDSSPCHNGGTCVPIFNNYYCTCPPEWAGPRNCDFANPCNAAGGYCSINDGCGTDPNESGGSGNSGGQSDCCYNGGVCTAVCTLTGCQPKECACPNFWTGPECCICPVGYCGTDCELEGEACPGFKAQP